MCFYLMLHFFCTVVRNECNGEKFVQLSVGGSGHHGVHQLSPVVHRSQQLSSLAQRWLDDRVLISHGCKL